MTEPVAPVPISRLPDPAVGTATGEGAQTALAAMIRKRKMAEHHVADEPVPASPKPGPDA